MSSENVEIVRRIYEAAARRDRETVLALYDPEVELDNTQLGLQTIGGAGGVFRGHDGMRSFFREWHEVWEKVDYDYDELIEAGDRVVSVVTRRVRGKASGVPIEAHVALLWTLRDGKVVRVVWFKSSAEALDAAGVEG